VNKSKFKLKVH